jgi:Scaffold protein Nfu/NifU N terminal
MLRAGYGAAMATASPTQTPNPDAIKFTLDVRLPGMINLSPGDDPTTPFEREVLAVSGVANLFGVNDFVTVTRAPGADWDPIIAAVRHAAEEHL